MFDETKFSYSNSIKCVENVLNVAAENSFFSYGYTIGEPHLDLTLPTGNERHGGRKTHVVRLLNIWEPSVRPYQ